MKLVNIVITATVPDEATEAELDLIAFHAAVQVEEPADEEGEDLDWSPVAVNHALTVETIS